MYWVAHDGTRAVGMVAVGGNTIRELYGLPSERGAGVGPALYEVAESAIRSAGHSEVVPGAFSSAVPFYEARGCRVVGVKDPNGVLAGLRITLLEKRF
jgi:GNAT superfamily N-acetyltransferase